MDAIKTTSRVACLALLVTVSSTVRVARAQDTDACINASEKALALRKAEKLIDARASLSTCAASSCPDAVRTSCQQRLAETNQTIPSIVFFAKDGTGRDLTTVKLTIDGAIYADHLDGSAIVRDPGEHEFRFEATGQEPVVKRFVLHAGEQNRREDIVIGAAPAAPATASVPPASAAPVADQGPVNDGRIQRTIGLVVGGVGVVGLVVGGIFGALSMSAHSSYEQNCGSNIGAPAGFCNSAGVSGESDAATKGTISTAFFIGGAVATAAGAVLFFTAPSGPSSTQGGLGPAGVLVKGQF